MAYGLRSYSGKARATTLLAAINEAVTSFTVTDASTWLEGPGYTLPLGHSGYFVVSIDYGTSTEEKVLCSAVNTSTGVVTVVTRGYDGLQPASTGPGNAHALGATVVPVFSAAEAIEANYAVNETVGNVALAGDMLVAAGANNLTRLAAGSSGSVLQVSSGVVGWSAAGASGYLLQSTGSGVQWTPSVPPHAQFDNSGGTAQTVTITAGGADQQTTLTISATPVYSQGASGPTVSSNVATINRTGLYKITLRASVNQNATAAVFQAVLLTPNTDGTGTLSHYGSSIPTNNTTGITQTSMCEVIVPIFTTATNKSITPKISFNTIGSGSFVVPKNAGQTSLAITYLGPVS